MTGEAGEELNMEPPTPRDAPDVDTGTGDAEQDAWDAVYAFVRTIPPGKVATYGQVAACVTEVAVTARQVGAAMNVVPPEVPWQRVVGAGGALPIAKRGSEYKDRQKRLLEQEGVTFVIGKQSGEARVDMRACQWQNALAPESSDALPSLFDEA